MKGSQGFLKVPSLVLLHIAQDCSLGQCLTSSRAETSKKEKKMAQIEAEMIYSNLLVVLGLELTFIQNISIFLLPLYGKFCFR